MVGEARCSWAANNGGRTKTKVLTRDTVKRGAKSCFKAHLTNPVYLDYRKQMWSLEKSWRLNRENRKLMLKGVRKEHRKKDREKMWDERPLEMAMISKLKDTTAKVIDRFPDRHVRRVLHLWTLRKLVGRPKECKRCGSLGTPEHIKGCSGLDPTLLLIAGQYLEAAKAIVEICRWCLGWSAEDLTRGLRRCEEAAETWRTQEGMVETRGANAYWRYFAGTRPSS